MQYIKRRSAAAPASTLNRFARVGFLITFISLTVSPIALLKAAESDRRGKTAQTEPDPLMQEIVVWGRKQQQLGTAFSASEGLVGYADFEVRPIQRIGELTEVIPGMVATQHSGEGKANQYYLRSMNLDHGTDFSVYFEGMPLNLRAHAHGQGYLDLNFLIPETIASVAYAKGPYRANRGDFSSAGTMAVELDNQPDDPFVKITADEDAYLRLTGILSRPIGDGNLLTAIELTADDGPWQRPNETEKINLISQWSKRLRDTDIEVTLLAYDSEWSATDQVPRRSIENSQL